MPEFAKMTADEYLKLTTIACSRYFHVAAMPERLLATPIIGKTLRKRLVDMFNYYADKADQTEWHYFDKEKVFAFIADEDIARNEIVKILKCYHRLH